MSTILDYKQNGEPISESSLFIDSDDFEFNNELDSLSTVELLRQLEVPIPQEYPTEAEVCTHTVALSYRGETYFVDPTIYEDVEFFITDVLDSTFFGYNSEKKKQEFTNVIQQIFKAMPEDIFNDPENRLLRLISTLPILTAITITPFICSRIAKWDEARYKLLILCVESVCRLPDEFLEKHSRNKKFRKIVYDNDVESFGNCRESSSAYSHMRAYLNSKVK